MPLSALVLGGCYWNLGLGYGAGSPTAHIGMGIAIPLGDRGNAHLGGEVAGTGGAKDEPSLLSGPLWLGGNFNVLGSRHHALTVVGDVSAPVAGDWAKTPDEEVKSIGRAYAGAGYS